MLKTARTVTPSWVHLFLTPLSSSASPSTALLRAKWVQPSTIKAVNVSTSPLQLTQRPQEKSDEGQADGERIKPYEELPTPKRIPVLNVSRDFLEVAKDPPSQIVRIAKKRVKELGHIYREKLAPGFPETVFVLNPEDIEKVYHAGGKYPRRFPLPEWIEARNKVGTPVGLLNLEGEEWHQQRIPIAKYMMVPQKVSEFHMSFNEVALDMIKIIQREKSPGNDLLLDIPTTLFRWSFESLFTFVLGKRLGYLKEKMPEDCKDMFDNILSVLNTTQDLLYKVSFHKFWPTKNWKKLVRSFDRVSKVAMSHIQEKLADIKKEDADLVAKEEEVPVGVDFITYMVHKGNMSIQEITSNTMDFMEAGVDTTSYTLSWCLYSLATNPEVQEILRCEVEKVVGSEEIVTPTHINNIPYLRDCIKETQRLYPVAQAASTRITSEEVILSGYRVPAETQVIFPYAVIGTLPEYFKEPERFMPERWSRDNKDTPNAFSSLPFGHGSRMCVGRRVAELELHIALAQLVRRFRFEYREDKPMNYLQKIVLVPERQLNIAFVDLK